MFVNKKLFNLGTPQPSTTEDILKQKIMREIKFRAWQSQKKKMHIQGDVIDENRKVFWGMWETTSHISEPMQFTGLKDKNGVEIYEGDILEHNGKKYEVKFSENQFNLLLKDVGSKTNWRSLEWCNNVSKYINIIGNIYQNPELLK